MLTPSRRCVNEIFVRLSLSEKIRFLRNRRTGKVLCPTRCGHAIGPHGGRAFRVERIRRLRNLGLDRPLVRGLDKLTAWMTGFTLAMNILTEHRLRSAALA